MYSINNTDKKVEIIFENGEVYMELHSSTGFVKLTPSRYSKFMMSKEEIFKNLKTVNENGFSDYSLHLGGNVFVSVSNVKQSLEILQWKFTGDNNELLPSENGVDLILTEFEKLLEIFENVEIIYPIFQLSLPCDTYHANQIHFFTCPECFPTPDGFDENLW